MTAKYFTRLRSETPTRVWVNNPTPTEVDLALAQGAVGSTTNPAYAGGLLRRAPEVVEPFLAEAVAEVEDDERAVALVQEKLVARVLEQFLPLYSDTEGELGYVSLQGAPEADRDSLRIFEEAEAARRLGPNVIVKVPATEPGLAAFERMVGNGFPTIVTEVFSLAQLIETCERYLAVSSRTGQRPHFCVSPITGIFGDYLKSTAPREGHSVGRDEIEMVGVALSRACYQLALEREYPVTLLCGGARTVFDLTGLVGGGLHVTINWSTFAEVMARDDVRLSRGVDEPIDASTIMRLRSAFADVNRALEPDGLGLLEFEDFGPVQHFRRSFISGWNNVRDAVAQRRMAVA